MSDLAIRVDGLSKLYHIGARQARYRTLRDSIMDVVGAPFRRLASVFQGRASTSAEEDLWALKDISFDVRRGEVVGIIGRNGAGKSTLLKVLSRITEPTKGRVGVKGRVGSLLEVGTGFHPELTGRENVFLNGAILGMRRAETDRKFDEIVGFAGLEKFIDTPVKHYSSGMYMRLAFGVAAHLEPEILLIDEVLAVGDAEFQKRCLGKMEDVAKQGRTVLFVSHHMPSIARLCRRAILLDNGSVKLEGDVFEVTSRYLRTDQGSMAERSWTMENAPGDDMARLLKVRVLQNGEACETVDIRQPVVVEMEYAVAQEASLLAGVSFFTAEGVLAFVSGDMADQQWKAPRPPGTYVSRCEVPGNLFSEGQIRIVPEISTREPVYHIHVLEYDAAAFQVVDKGEQGSVRAGWGRPIPGAMRPQCRWETKAKA